MAAKILLVEDDNNLREIYEARLEAEGYTIVTAKDGEEALVIAKAEKPDLIISDVMMPRISGFEMLDILRNTSELKYTKVIMLTALGQADDQTRATSLGADRYLVKSQVTLEDIVKAAHELIEGVPPAAPSVAVPATNTAVPAPAVAQPSVTPPQPPAAVPSPAVPPASVPPHSEPVPVVPKPEPLTPVAAPLQAPQPPTTPTPVPSISPTPVPPVPPVPAPVSPPERTEVPVVTPASMIPRPTTPTPQPVPDHPAPAAQSADTTVRADATPTADEQAAMHTQIEDFINSNLTHPEAAAASQQGAKPAQAPVPDTSSDDALLASAVKDLTTPSAPTVSDSATTAPTPPVQSAPEPQSTPTPGHPTMSSSVTIANKKVIQPLKSDKPGLDELLAREEAREQANSLGTITPSAPSVPPSPFTGTPSGQPTAPLNPPALDNPPQQPSSGPDPNSIAL